MSWWYTSVQFGTSGSDTLTGDAGRDILFGGAGDDILSGGDGNDSLFGGSGDDLLDGGNGNDWLFGGSGDDWMYGGAGNDTLFGGSGNDHISGDTGSDFIIAGRGEDVIQAGEGSDIVFAGRDNDLIIHDVSANLDSQSYDFYHGGSGTDTLMLLVTADQKQALIDAGVQQLFTDHMAAHSGRVFNFENLGPIFDGLEMSIFTRKVENLVLNQKVQAADDHGTTDEDTVLIGDSIFANDDDNIIDDFKLLTPEVTSATGVTVIINADGTYEYDPRVAFGHLAEGALAQDSFDYQIEILDPFDGSVLEVQTATVYIDIMGKNDGPVAVADVVEAHENQPLLIDVLANDTDVDDGHVLTLDSIFLEGGTAIEFAIFTALQQDGLSIVDNKISFPTDSEFFNHLSEGQTFPVRFNYTMSDEHGVSSSSSVDITVTGTNDGPVAVVYNDGGGAEVTSYTVAEDLATGAAISSAASTTDVDTNDTHTYSIIAGNATGTFSIDAMTGVVSLADGNFLDYETAMSHLLTIQTDDGNGGLHSENLTINVSDVIETSVYEHALSEYSFEFSQAYTDSTLTTELPGAGFLTITHNGPADEGIDNLVVVDGQTDIDVLKFAGESYNLVFDLNETVHLGTAGNDIMIGNNDADTFVLGSGNDIVIGFELGQDIIDVSGLLSELGLDPQTDVAFSFNGSDTEITISDSGAAIQDIIVADVNFLASSEASVLFDANEAPQNVLTLLV